MRVHQDYDDTITRRLPAPDKKERSKCFINVCPVNILRNGFAKKERSNHIAVIGANERQLFPRPARPCVR